MRDWGLARTVLFAILAVGLAAQSVEISYEVTDVNQLGLMVWNYGILGNGYSQIDGQILPSCQYLQYPEYLHEQVEHFSFAGLWVGGIVDGQKRVSTAIVDGVFELGQEGFEYLPLSEIQIRSSLTSSPFFHPEAISHQDLLIDFKDYGDNENDNFGIPNHVPLGIDIHLESYTWNLTYTESFAILNYVISNVSGDTIRDIYAGIWSDASVANMNYTNAYEPGGGFTWYDNLDGFDVSFDESGFQRNIGYQYDADGDDTWAESYIGFTVLGGTVAGPYFTTHYNQWVWSSTTNQDYPEYVMSLNDTERYDQLSSSVPMGSGGLYTAEGYPNQPNSWLLMISAGPLGSQPANQDSSSWELPPGDSVSILFAVVTARWNGSEDDSPLRRANLRTYADRVQNVYHGEDVNRNNILDEGEDIDGDGELDHFILPADPPQNMAATWNYPTVTLTWQPPPQFIVGYNLYKNDELETSLTATDTVFLDTTVMDSGITSYFATSVNEWGWESTPSNTVRDYSLPPSIEFVYGSNPSIADLPTDTSFTFPTRTFLWNVYDPEGVETVEQVYYALDDTSLWVELEGYQRSITLENLTPGMHTFYLKAVDEFGLFSSTILFPDPQDPSTVDYWKVMPVIGDVLLVDDFATDSQNNAQNWYRSILDTIATVGAGNYSVWEIGDVLPYSAADVTANLNYFDHVIWYAGYAGHETYGEAGSSISSFVMNGGNILMNVIDFGYDTTFIWFPLDSLFTLNPSGRIFPGRTLVSQISSDLDLETSSLIAVRVKGFETFMGDSLECPQFRSLYRMQEPGAGDEWLGTPNVCGTYRFEALPGGCSGKVVLMSLPLHNGYEPVLEGNGTAGKFIKYVLEEQFSLRVPIENASLPTRFYVYQNYPNPFNSQTSIRYDLPRKSHVVLKVYDVLGREVRTLVRRLQEVGTRSIAWDASDDGGRPVSSGVYFYEITVGSSTKAGKMLLLR